MNVDKSLMLFSASSRLVRAGTCLGGSESPGRGLGASLLRAPVPFCYEQGARPGQSHRKICAGKTSLPFLTLWFSVSCSAGDTELCGLWASSERDCDRMEVLTAIPPGIFLEGFLKIALSPPARFSCLHSRGWGRARHTRRPAAARHLGGVSRRLLGRAR